MQPLSRDPWPEQLPPSFFAALAVDAAGETSPPDASGGSSRAQAALRLLQALPDGVLSLDADLRCRHANPAAQPLLRPHLAWNQIEHLSWHEAVDDDWIDILLPWMAPALRGEGGCIGVQRERDGAT
ncbi:MAG: PAS domain-containing protein, partial [Tepidimonas sp.]|uniref:PAS domain-containing protein n=1 Tax=Tepidimonas sp. TaxID=2002775 RepID=UPI0040550142